MSRILGEAWEHVVRSNLYRLKVPTGWLVTPNINEFDLELTFVPDPSHLWLPEKINEDKDSSSINILDLSNRNTHVLKRLNLTTINDLVLVLQEKQTFAVFRGIGAKSAREIHDKLYQYLKTKEPKV